MLNVQNVDLKQTVFYQEVRLESEQSLLQRMLTRRFGELPTQLKQLLSHANATQIEQWADRFIDATTLEAIFGDFKNKN
jgi:hypothetical protein